MKLGAWALVLSTCVISVASCRGVLGIEDRTLADAGDTVSCQTYCEDALAGCQKPAIYTSMEQCLATCPLFTTGQLTDKIGNTLGCRQSNAHSARIGGEQDACQAAAIGGNNQCGTSECDVYCELLPKVCPEQAKMLGDCAAACKNVPKRPPFSVPTPDENSIECRLYHLSNATLGALEHCPHAAGLAKCVDQNPDGGDGG